MADITDKNSLVSQAKQIVVMADCLEKVQRCIDLLGGSVTPWVNIEGVVDKNQRSVKLPLLTIDGLESAREDVLLALTQAFETYRDAVERVLRSTLRGPG